LATGDSIFEEIVCNRSIIAAGSLQSKEDSREALAFLSPGIHFRILIGSFEVLGTSFEASLL
jgi:hypothetical protein